MSIFGSTNTQTSLVNALLLETGNWNIFSKKKVEETISTIGVDVWELKRLNFINSIDISVWDFAGQLEYANNHQVIIQES